MATTVMARSGMTLAEVLAVVVLLAILAGIALPNMRKAVLISYREEAQHVLNTIHDGEQRYFDKEEIYQDVLVPCTPPDPVCLADWRAIFLDDPNLGTVPVDFRVDPGAIPGTTFLATATNTTTSEFMTIDQDGFLDTTGWPPP